MFYSQEGMVNPGREGGIWVDFKKETQQTLHVDCIITRRAGHFPVFLNFLNNKKHFCLHFFDKF